MIQLRHCERSETHRRHQPKIDGYRYAPPILQTLSNEMTPLSQRLLLVPALLAGELDAGRAFFRLDAVRRAAFAAGGFNTGIALFDDDGLLFHRLADQALGLLAHRLLRHRLRTCRENRWRRL